MIEGCLLAGYAIGATKCYIYIKENFNELLSYRKQLMKHTEKIFGKNVFDLNIDFDICSSGSGAYVCGEETALIESLREKRSTKT